jgi:two-component system, NtrC family, sensor kinase
MQTPTPKPIRILVVDDNRAIHDDFRKILSFSHGNSAELDQAEAAIFGSTAEPLHSAVFQIDSAYQGAEGVQLVEQSLRDGDPYPLAFMDVRMPPGLDGIETTAEIWKRYPDLQVVLCTAYSDYSWTELLAKLGSTDRLVILKKPFDNIEVLQLAHTLTEKWRLLQQARTKMADMEKMVSERTVELRNSNEQLQIEIAERKQAQAALEESHKMVLRQERLAAVGQLSAGVAHDFNNIMTVIHGHASLLLLNDQVPGVVHDPLREIEAAAMRAAKLTQQLLAFSRKQVMQPRNINLGEVANSLSAMLGRTIGEQITLQCQYSPALPTVHADPSMIEQVLMNLAVNARDAMPNGGDLTINVDPVEISKKHAARNPEACAGRFVCLSVRDTGCGMDKDIASRIFEPFFTTKDVGKGTGLGLATVYGIAKQHHGWIEVESALGRGSLFQIFFPAIESAAAKPDLQTTTTDVSRGNGETILVVEDEPALRFLVRKIIQRYGYSVIEAKSGREALAIWERQKQQIDLLLTGIVMPEGISGKDLAKTLLSENPDLKIIFTTGCDRNANEENFSFTEGFNLIRKPYAPRALAEMIHSCLHQVQNGAARPCNTSHQLAVSRV